MNEAKAHAFGWVWLLALTAAGLAGAVLFRFDPSQCSFYPVCVFHRLTGLQCPGCGTLRALHQLLHGNLAGAWHFNALLVVSLPLFAWWSGRRLWRGLRGESQPAPGVRPAWLWGMLGAVLAFGIARNLPLF